MYIRSDRLTLVSSGWASSRWIGWTFRSILQSSTMKKTLRSLFSRSACSCGLRRCVIYFSSGINIQSSTIEKTLSLFFYHLCFIRVWVVKSSSKNTSLSIAFKHLKCVIKYWWWRAANHKPDPLLVGGWQEPAVALLLWPLSWHQRTEQKHGYSAFECDIWLCKL